MDCGWVDGELDGCRDGWPMDGWMQAWILLLPLFKLMYFIVYLIVCGFLFINNYCTFYEQLLVLFIGFTCIYIIQLICMIYFDVKRGEIDLYIDIPAIKINSLLFITSK